MKTTLVPYESGNPMSRRVQLASDRSKMLELFQQHLTWVPEACGAEIVDCTVDRVRYVSDASRATLSYTLRLRDRTGAMQTRHVAGIIHEHKPAAGIWRKLNRSQSMASRLLLLPQEQRTFLPFTVIDELDMLVEIFPFDRQLPQLIAAYSAIPQDWLPSLGRAFDIEPEDEWQILERTVELVRYRIGLAAVLRRRLQIRIRSRGSHGSRHASRTRMNDDHASLMEKCVYVKVHDPTLAYATYRKLKSIYAYFAERPHMGIFTVRPLHLDEVRGMIVFEEMSGDSWEQLLIDHPDATEASLVAQRLAKFHLSECPLLSSCSATATRVRFVKAAERLVSLVPERQASIERLLRRSLEVGDSPLVPTHQDVKIEHLFLDGERMGFLDMDGASLGIPALDLAMLVTRLEVWGLRQPTSTKSVFEWIQLLSDVYFRLVPEAWRRDWEALRAGSRLEVAAALFSRNEPAWAALLGE